MRESESNKQTKEEERKRKQLKGAVGSPEFSSDQELRTSIAYLAEKGSIYTCTIPLISDRSAFSLHHLHH